MSAVLESGVPHRSKLWFGLFGGALAWTAHLMLAYLIAEFGCVGQLGERDYLGLSLVAWLELALTALTTLAAAAATTIAYVQHRRLQASQATNGDTTALTTAWLGLLTSGLFTFIIVFESIPILYYLQSC